MIGILDYGMGNINAFYNIYKENNINLKIINQPQELNHNIKKLIIPGVGSFDRAIGLLKKKNFYDLIINFTENDTNKLLGICIGMQILTLGSSEGNSHGLGLVNGNFKKLSKNIVPHIGWNNIQVKKKNDLFDGIEQHSYFYFLHTYALLSLKEEYVICETSYGEKFISAFNKKNIYGIQFHPEKSHLLGERILLNFYKNA